MNDIQWILRNGDVNIVEGQEDIIQAIVNRLNTDTDELDYLYDNYGCNLKQFLGLPANDTTLELVKNNISNALSYDTRLELVDLTLSYTDANTLNILITCTYDSENELELDLVLNSDGVEING